jgi:hypothetical protein
MLGTSTPFKILSNPVDENQGSVFKGFVKGNGPLTARKGLSNIGDSVSKPTNSVVKSTRKALVDLSNSQVNARLTSTVSKAQRPADNVSKPIMQFKVHDQSSNPLTKSVAKTAAPSLSKPKYDIVRCNGTFFTYNY